MFPDFHYLFKGLFGIDIEGLAVIKTFGFFVALGFFVGGWVLYLELKRKKEAGLFEPEIVTEVRGKPASTSEILWMAVLGFVIGFKLVGLFFNAGIAAQDPLGFIFSGQGNWPAGLILGGLMGYLRYSDKKKHQLPTPKTVKTTVYPHQRVTDLLFAAAIAGFVGAKLFNAFETWEDFIRNPIASLLSPSGLTFYGGLILATITLYVYARKKGFSFAHLCDAAAPALILAYGIGRLGCQFSGDGDWGIFNSAYITQADGKLVEQPLGAYQALVKETPHLFIDRNENQLIPEKYAPAPSWLPDWLYAQNFKHNVNNEGIPIANDSGAYNHVLPAGVFPTSLYEAVICGFLFLILWGLRRRLKYPLQLFGLYLIFNGLERFLIEKIRVNYKYDWGFIHPTQAEIISFCLAAAGLYLLFRKRKKTVLP